MISLLLGSGSKIFMSTCFCDGQPMLILFRLYCSIGHEIMIDILSSHSTLLYQNIWSIIGDFNMLEKLDYREMSHIKWFKGLTCFLVS
jgi:hypothetical protein